MEELELELIDFEVEEVFQDEDGVMIYAPFEQYGNLQKYLEDHDLEILSSGFERIPQNTVALTEEQREEVEKILDKLDELDDVQQVYTSME
jgi:transcriptional/translational regulatory protein YebC/TACO1